MDNIFGPEMSFTSTTGLSLGTRPISQTFFGAVRWHIRYIREVKSFFYTHAVSQYLINSFSVISLWFCWVSSCKFILHSVYALFPVCVYVLLRRHRYLTQFLFQNGGGTCL